MTPIVSHVFTRDGNTLIPLPDMVAMEGEDEDAVVVHQTKVIVDQTAGADGALQYRITFVHYI
jgi:hypothetical protein